MVRKGDNRQRMETRGTHNETHEDGGRGFTPQRTTRDGVVAFNAVLFVAVCCIVLACCYAAQQSLNIWSIIAAVVAALLVSSSVHIALAWERVVVLRFGKISRIAGPGLYFTIPVIEYGTVRIDQRVIATPFDAERTLTADLVPVNIDAVLFWVVRDAEEASTEVEDYYSAVLYLAQTSMREAVGRSSIAEVALRRDQLDSEIMNDIAKETAGWGIDVIAVKVRDIVLPESLQDVMSLEAQAEREKNARMTVAGVEDEIADILKEAGEKYGDPDAAIKLRSMLMQYDTVKKSKGTVVTVPSALSDGFVDADRR